MRSRSRLILVTGSPRSGTAAVGRVLASVPGAHYVREPMNRWLGDRVIQHAFEIPGIGGFSHEVCSDLVERIGALRLQLRVGLTPQDRDLMFVELIEPINRVLINVGRRIYMRCARLHLGSGAVIWKDPFAVLCIPWILDNTDIPVVVTVRPIEAVAASYKRLGWRFGLREVLHRVEQAELINRAEKLKDFDLKCPVVIGAIVWCMVYECIIARIPSSTPHKNKLIMCDMDEIISDPLTKFQSIFDRLKLPFDERIKKNIKKQYLQNKHKDKIIPKSTPYDRKRDLSNINSYWAKILDAHDIEVIERIKYTWASSVKS